MNPKMKSPYAYISYVTAREIWQEVKGYFVIWVIVSALSLLIGASLDFGFNMAKDVVDSGARQTIPNWLVSAAVISFLAWFLRGKQFVFPDLTLKSWLVLTAIMSLFMFLVDRLPFWAMAPVYWAILSCGAVLDGLVEKGKANYSKLSGKSIEDEL